MWSGVCVSCVGLLFLNKLHFKTKCKESSSSPLSQGQRGSEDFLILKKKNFKVSCVCEELCVYKIWSNICWKVVWKEFRESVVCVGEVVLNVVFV